MDEFIRVSLRDVNRQTELTHRALVALEALIPEMGDRHRAQAADIARALAYVSRVMGEGLEAHYSEKEHDILSVP